MRTMFKNYFKLLVCLGVFVGSWLASLDVGAQVTWTGGTSGNWNVPSNWSTGALPTISDNVIIPAGNRVTVPVNMAAPGAQALTLKISADDANGTNTAVVDIADDSFITINTKLFVSASNPFETSNVSSGTIVTNLTGGIGNFEVQRYKVGISASETDTEGSAFVTIPEIAVIGNKPVAFVTGTSGYISGDGTTNDASIFISAGTGQNGIALLDRNDKLYINANGGILYEGTQPVTIGGLGGSIPASVFITSGRGITSDLEIVETSGLGFSTITFTGDLTFLSGSHIDPAGSLTDNYGVTYASNVFMSVNVLRVVHDFVNNTGTPYPVTTNTSGSGTQGFVLFSNLSQGMEIKAGNGNAFTTLSGIKLDVSKDNELGLLSNLTLDGSAGAFVSVLDIANHGGVDINGNNTLYLSPTSTARNAVFATANPAKINHLGEATPSGRILGTGFLSISATTNLGSDLAVESNIDVGAGLDFGTVQGDFNLYLAGSKVNVSEGGDFFFTAGNSKIEFFDNNDGDTNDFITITIAEAATGDFTIFPRIEIAKENGSIFITGGDDMAIGGFNSSATHMTNAALAFTSISFEDKFVTTSTRTVANATQVILGNNFTLGFGTASLLPTNLGGGLIAINTGLGIYDQTGGLGEISGSGTVFLSAPSFVSAFSTVRFRIGANLNSNDNGLDLNGEELHLGGSLTGNGFITTSTPTANDEGITFVTINGIPNMADKTTAAGDFSTATYGLTTSVGNFTSADLLDFGTVANVTLQRDMAVNQSFFISADNGAGVQFATIVNFDGGGFVTATNQGTNPNFISAFISAHGSDHVMYRSGNAAESQGFNLNFLTIEYSGTSPSIDLVRATAGNFNFGLADVFLTADNPVNGGGSLDADRGTLPTGDVGDNVTDVVFAGSVFNGTDQVQFVTVDGTVGFVVFDINFSSVNNSGTFLTVDGIAGAVSMQRLKVKGDKGYQNTGSLSCFENTLANYSEGLVFTTFTTISGDGITVTTGAVNTADVVLDLSENGNILITAKAGQPLESAALAFGTTTPNVTGGRILLTTASVNYSVIGGTGTLSLNSTRPAAGQGFSFTPNDGKVIVGPDLLGYIEIDSELALAGDLFATVLFDATDPPKSTGTIRLVGTNVFQTVAPGKDVNVTGSATGTEMGYIPNLIVDKCGFTTAFQSAGWNLYTDGFITVLSGIYDLNGFITVNSVKSSITGYFITAPAGTAETDSYANTGSFITTSQDATISGILFDNGNNIGAVPYQVGFFATARPGQNTSTITRFATVMIPNMVIDNANVFASSTNIAVFNTVSTTSVPYALDFRHDPAAVVGNFAGGLDLNQNTLFITGGIGQTSDAYVRVRQHVLPASFANVDGDVAKGTYATNNTFAITDGFTTVTGAGTIMFMTADATLGVSRFTVNNFAVFASAGVEMNDQILEVTGNFTHNSFSTAFITTTSNDGYVDMSAKFATITFMTGQLQLPALKVSGFVTVNGNPGNTGADLILGVGRSSTSFTSVLEIGRTVDFATTQLNIGNNFLTITGNGGWISGTVTGGTKSFTDGGAARIESFVTVTAGNFTFISAGVEVFEYATAPTANPTTGSNFATAFTTGRINVLTNTLILGGNLYENTSAFATTDQFITGDTGTGLVVFDCPANERQFITSNGGATAINTNVFISGNEVQLGSTPNSTSNILDFYLGGTAKNGAGGKATLVLQNSGAGNNALLNLNFNSVTFMTAAGHLYDSDGNVSTYTNASCGATPTTFTTAKSIIGFGTVTFTDGGTMPFTTTTLETDFGIEGNLFSSVTAQINLNGRNLFLSGSYTNDASVTTTFVTGSTNDNSALVMHGTGFKTIGLGSFTTVTYTDIPSVAIAGVTQLGNNIRLYGGGGTALALMTVTELNGNFITVDNDGTTINSVYAESDAKLMGLAFNTARDGLYFATSANQQSNLTVDQADVFITAGGTLTMTGTCPQPYTLNIGGDLAAINDVANLSLTTITDGAFITSALNNEHGYVKFISTTDTNLKFHTISGINTMPGLVLDIPMATAHFMSAPNGFLSVTSNASASVLEFMSGNLHLNMTTVSILGTGNNTIDDKTKNNQVFVTANASPITGYLGSIQLKGSGHTTLNIGDYGNGFATAWKINPGLSMEGTFIPNLIVEKLGAGNAVLNGNLFTSALHVNTGDVLLKGNNIQFMTGGELTENLAGEHLVSNEFYTATYPTTAGGSNYANNPSGVLFATAYRLTGFITADASKTLGLLFSSASGAVVEVEMRKDGWGDGLDAINGKVIINRNYHLTQLGGNLGTNDMMMPFATSEIGLTNITPESLDFVTFAYDATTTTGKYSSLSTVKGQSPTIPAFNTAFMTSSKVVSGNIISGYITLGIKPISIFHDDYPVTTDKSYNEADENNSTNGYFRIEHPRASSTVTVEFVTTGSSAIDNNGFDDDFDFSLSGGATASVTKISTGYRLVLPAFTTTTFLTVTPKDDTFLEGTEFVSVKFTSISQGFVLGFKSADGLSIVDNDVVGYEVNVYNKFSTASPAYEETMKVTSQSTLSTSPVDVTSSQFVTVNEFVVGKDEVPDFATVFVTVSVKLRTQPMPNRKVTMKLTLKDNTEIAFHTVQGTSNGLGSVMQSGQESYIEIPFASSTVLGTSNQWDKFVSVVLVGANDQIIDSGYPAINEIAQLIEVSVETNATKTTSLDYINPGDFVPTTTGSGFTTVALKPLGKVTIKGGNIDNERALHFAVSNLSVTEGALGVLEIAPNISLTADATLTLMLDNSKDATCDYDVTRFMNFSGNDVLSSTNNSVTVRFPQGQFASKFVTVSAKQNNISDGNDKVLLKGSVTTTGLVSPNLFGATTQPQVESANQFHFTINDDGDVAGIKDVDDITVADGFVNDGGIYRYTTTESNKGTVSYPVELKTMPHTGGTVFITTYVEGTASDRVSISTDASHEVLNTTIGGVKWTGVVLKLVKTTKVDVKVTVKDNEIKDGDALIQLRFTSAQVSNKCDDAYRSVKPTDAFVRIMDDASDKAVSVPTTPVGAPAKVAGVVATPGSRQVVLNWAPNAEAGVSYQVYVYQFGQPKRLAGETTSTSFTVTGLTNGMDYFFEIVAVKKDATGKVVARGIASDDVTARPSIILGTEKAKVATLDVYPNPSKQLFNVRLVNLNAEQLEVKVLSVTGQEIYARAHGTVNGEFETAVDLDGMPAGMYVLIVNTDNGSFRTKLVLTR